jgi:arsenate reductase
MNILFLCVGNSARSQMAEGLAKNMLGDNFNIKSAGSKPSGEIHPNAIACMDDIGINIRDQYSKHIDNLDKEFMSNLDYVITLCAEEVCPSLPIATKRLHWINEDPVNINYSDKQLKYAFSTTRDNIFKLIKKFIILNIK